jgi:hypothetical protein
MTVAVFDKVLVITGFELTWVVGEEDCSKRREDGQDKEPEETALT